MEATAAFSEGVNKSNFHKAPGTSEGYLGLQDQICGPGDAGSFLPGEGAPLVFARKALVLPTARRFKLLVAEAGGGGGGDGRWAPQPARSAGLKERERENVELRRLPEKQARGGQGEGGGDQFVYPRARLEGASARVCFHMAMQWLSLDCRVTGDAASSDVFVSESSLISKDILQETEPCLPTLKLAKENKTLAQQWGAAVHRKSE